MDKTQEFSNFEVSFRISRRECDELKEENLRLIEDLTLMRDREKRSEERRQEVSNKYLDMVVEKNKTISELNAKIIELKTRELENHRIISECQDKMNVLDIRVLEITKEKEDLRLEKLVVDEIVNELKLQISESDDKTAELIEKIGNLTEETIAVLNVNEEGFPNPINDLDSLFEAEGRFVNVSYSKGEIECSENGSILVRSLADDINVDFIYNSSERKGSPGLSKKDATPSSNVGEKEKSGYGRMHACNSSLNKDSPKLPQYSRMEEDNGNNANAENIAIEQEMGIEISEGSDCMEIDKGTFFGLKSSENFCEKENMISEEFPVTSFIVKMKRNDKKWVIDADMLTDFEEDEELCMNAVLVLYRQQISASKSTADSYGELSHSDVKSVRELGEYLVDQSPGFLPGKSLTEVKTNRPDVVVECRRLATVYLEKLFHLYLNGEDPLFKVIKSHKLR